MRLILALLIFATPLLGFASDAASVKPSWSYVETQLKKAKFSKSFIAAMKTSYEPERFEEVLRLNVLLFLKKSDYHGVQVSSEATEEVKRFSDTNRAALEAATTQYGVPGNVIASLIWIESRHGRNVGNFHVPSAYLHLLQAPRKEVIKYLYTQTSRFTEKTTLKQRRDIPVRAKKKVKFALAELKAIEKIHKWNWKIGADFRGSFAGAFGMPQFIPSSYVMYARPLVPGTQPNLMTPEDAIMSVGHYLKVHGWKSERDGTRLKALMKYNNSSDYANAILKLADTVEQRSTASTKK